MRADEPHACFRAALIGTLARLECEGQLPLIDGGARVYVAVEDSAQLSIAVSAGAGPPTIVAARHSGVEDAWLRAACDSFCRLIEGSRCRRPPSTVQSN